MNQRNAPEWFAIGQEITGPTMERIAASVRDVDLPLQIKFLPMQSHWFILDSLLLANRANREGMHANALALTRQCVEAISIIDIGLSNHVDGPATLLQWEADKLSPGKARKWLSENVWNKYGCGIWSESWTEFMEKFASAVQPYAHYTTHLVKWQARFHGPASSDDDATLLIEYAPRAYDPQKATRITLFHTIITFALARMWMAHTSKADTQFSSLANRLRVALGGSEYLDGHETDWERQFWAIVWSKQKGTMLE